MQSESAALACGVSQPVGTRWFREAGGMPSISLAPGSKRYLSFGEREELALLRAQGVWNSRDRPMLRPITFDNLARAAS